MPHGDSRSSPSRSRSLALSLSLLPKLALRKNKDLETHRWDKNQHVPPVGQTKFAGKRRTER
eukprot:2408795-Rhodomonas_salina.2